MRDESQKESTNRICIVRDTWSALLPMPTDSLSATMALSERLSLKQQAVGELWTSQTSVREALNSNSILGVEKSAQKGDSGFFVEGSSGAAPSAHSLLSNICSIAFACLQARYLEMHHDLIYV